MAIAIDLVSLIVYSQFKKCGIPKAISSNKETERQVNDMFKIVFEWQVSFTRSICMMESFYFSSSKY